MSDCISRAELNKKLDYLCECLCEYSKKQREFMCKACKLGAVIDEVEEMPATEPEIDWISCRDRLPEYGRRVLLSYKDDGGVFFGYLHKSWEKVYRDDEVYTNIMRSEWIDDGDEHSFRLDEIEAWAPVPAGYKGGTDERNMGNDSGK